MSDDRDPDGSIALRRRLRDGQRPPAPWTAERRERVGRAAYWAATQGSARFPLRPDHHLPAWRALPEAPRETWRAIGEAAVRAYEGER